MQKPKQLRLALIGLAVALLGLGVWQKGSLLGPHLSAADRATTNNLYQIWQELFALRSTSPWTPETLAALNESSVDRNLFVAASSGSRPGLMKDVEDWTDYIYVGGIDIGIDQTVQLVSPPENHRGKFGFVIYVNGVSQLLTPEEIRLRLKAPWMDDHYANSNTVETIKQRMVLRVPKKLESAYPPSIYPRAYKTSPSRPPRQRNTQTLTNELSDSSPKEQ